VKEKLEKQQLDLDLVQEVITLKI